ncbi:hypothetical protein DIPPA_15894 [Diplonema papillatum]|nr:hypothetical protein DIPPA_15894 [Diplonema papillatum]
MDHIFTVLSAEYVTINGCFGWKCTPYTMSECSCSFCSRTPEPPRRMSVTSNT